MIKGAVFLFVMAGAAAAVLPGEAAQAEPRAARCVVEGRQTIPYDGPCLFETGRRGSFTIWRGGGRSFIGHVTSVSLEVTRQGAGEVRGLVGGVNTRWGGATRSKRDRACWIGADFRVCAY